jgi:hypothetical protein
MKVQPSEEGVIPYKILFRSKICITTLDSNIKHVIFRAGKNNYFSTYPPQRNECEV